MKRLQQLLARCAIAAILATTLVGCQSAYYSTMEKFGLEKRDILVDRVGEARDAQHDASKQFESALAEFTAITQFDGGDLQTKYDKLKKEFAKSQERAEKVNSKIDGVERVGKALFKEWAKEIELYSDSRLRRDSEKHYRQTQIRYQQLLTAMQKSEDRIEPVLEAFQDRVLYLKHNLNARALTSLQGDLETVRTDVSLLIQDMRKAIEEADQFLNELG